MFNLPKEIGPNRVEWGKTFIKNFEIKVLLLLLCWATISKATKFNLLLLLVTTFIVFATINIIHNSTSDIYKNRKMVPNSTSKRVHVHGLTALQGQSMQTTDGA